tara:strand:- start:3182 stop:5626 length:2445 start_codon:yes stop_codon:yes gene_type:complete
MIIKKYLVFTLIASSFLFGYYNQGLSISESDDVDAIFYNPAGLAVEHGKQLDFFYEKYKDSTFFFSNFKTTGFGFSIGYNENTIHSFRIGLATKIYKNLYYGYAWDKNNLIDVGLLYRPFNFISAGWTSTLFDDFSDFTNHSFGLAFRPFNSKFLTLGFDQSYDYEWKAQTASIFLKTIPINGLELSAKMSSNEYCDQGLPVLKFDDLGAHNLSLNVGLNFGSNKFYTNNSDDRFGSGLSYFSHKQPSIYEKKNKSRFVTLTFDDIFIEEKPKKSFFNFFSDKKGTQLRTWIEKIDKLTADPNISGMIIYLKNISASFSKRNEIRNALKRFKDSGKKIIVYSEMGISNMNYHTISIADEIYVNKLTGVDLKGLSMEVTFYKGLLDTLKIEPTVWRVEDKDGRSYKTAGDPFLNTKMSDEMRENYTQLLDDLNNIFIEDIAISRGWTNESLPDITYAQSIVNEGPYWQPEAAEERGLITGSYYPDQFKKYIKDSVIMKNNTLKFNNIGKISDYNYDWKEKNKPKIAMIYAVGGIVSGKSNSGPQGSSIMGDKTIINSIKKARNDKSIKAIILRIDSGGGSALASDQMWREIYKTTTDSINKKPFIASMSGVAASGGYYIACQADTIIAESATITGSIGVISMGFNLSELYSKIGINKEVIKRGDFSDLLTQSRKWTEEENEKMKKSVEYFYQEFKNRVLDGRPKLNAEKLDELALGRVWSGNEAFNNGLIDEIGGINETIDIAKIMANLNQEDIEIIEFPQSNKKGFNRKTNDGINIIFELMPDSFKKELNNLNIIPLLKDEKIYFILPYHIEVQ